MTGWLQTLSTSGLSAMAPLGSWWTRRMQNRPLRWLFDDSTKTNRLVIAPSTVRWFEREAPGDAGQHVEVVNLGRVPLDQPPASAPGVVRTLQELTDDVAEENRGRGFELREVSWWVTRNPKVVMRYGHAEHCRVCADAVAMGVEALQADPEAVVAVGRFSWVREL